MEKYGWNIEKICSKADIYQQKCKQDGITVEELAKYEDIVDTYRSLLINALFSEGKYCSKDYTNQQFLDAIRLGTSDIQKEHFSNVKSYETIIKELAKFDNIPILKSHKTFSVDDAIELVGLAIHDIFGDEAIRIFKKYIIESPHNIQLGLPQISANVSYINNPDEELYILLPKSKSIKLVRDLAHESGHIYRIKKNEYDVPYDSILKEFESYSYEIRILDYFIKNKINLKESIIGIMNLCSQIEHLALLVYENYKLHLSDEIFIRELKRKANKNDLFNRAGLNNVDELLSYLEYVITENIFAYFYSLVAVFDTLESDNNLEVYHQIVDNIGCIDDKNLAMNCFDDPCGFNNLSNYKKYRMKILALYEEVK